MTASLVVAGYELIGAATNPEYRLAEDLDFGSGEPDQTYVGSTYLDGDAVAGRRTRNRSMQLPVRVRGTGPADLALKVSTLLQAVSADTFLVQWWPDGGLPLVFECFRAAWSRPRDLRLDAQGETAVLLTFQAKPFGRSTAVQTVAAGTTTQIDSYDTAPTGATLDTTTKIEGTGSAKTGTGTSPSATVSRSFAAKDLSAATSVNFYWKIKSTGSGNILTTITATLTLTSASGSTRYPVVTINDYIGANHWKIAPLSLTGGVVVSGSGVTLSAVTSYSLALTYGFPNGTGQLTLTGQYIDDLRAVGSTQAATTTTHGGLLMLPAITGSARTPVNLAVTNGSTFVSVLLHSPPEDQDASLGILQSLNNALNDQTITIAADAANFDGTYSVVLGVENLGSSASTITVTITQLVNAVSVGTKVLTGSFAQVGPMLRAMGEVALPLVGVTGDNSTTTYTVQVTGSGNNEHWSEVMFCDTRGQTIYTDTDLPAARAAVYVDEPSPLQSGPSVYASTSDRSRAYSILGTVVPTGGPIQFEPGTNKILAWVDLATPVVTATYFPRWIDERVV